VSDTAYRDVTVRIVGIPADKFVDHGSVDDLRRLLRLDSAGIAAQIRETLGRMRVTPAGAKAQTANTGRSAAPSV
jgi:deoxyxylulose-5-phosphate synthase